MEMPPSTGEQPSEKSKERSGKPIWWKNRLAAATLAIVELVNLYQPKTAEAFDGPHLVAERAPRSAGELQAMVDQLKHPESFFESRDEANVMAEFRFGTDRVDGRETGLEHTVHVAGDGRLADLVDDGAISVSAATVMYHEMRTEDRIQVEAHTRDMVQIRGVFESIPVDASHRIEARGEMMEEGGSGVTLDEAVSVALTAIAGDVSGGPMDHVEGQEGYMEGNLTVSGRPNVEARTDWRYGLTLVQHAKLKDVSVEIVSSPDPDTHRGLFQVRVRAHRAVIVGAQNH